MEKKVSTSPVGKASTGQIASPTGKASTGKAASPSAKTPTGAVVAAPASPAAISPAATKLAAQPAGNQDLQQWCRDHMYRYVLLHTHDGWCCDGFLEHVDNEVVYMAIPYGGLDRAFFPGPFYPRRRFYRQVVPFGSVRGLSLLPFY